MPLHENKPLNVCENKLQPMNIDLKKQKKLILHCVISNVIRFTNKID